MQAQPQIVSLQSQAEEGLIELDLQSLVHVGGGAPKGTWNEPTETVEALSIDTDPAPKGTW